METRAVGAAAQGRRREGENSGTIALRNDDDAGMDSAAVADGNQDTSGAFAVLE